MLSAVAEFDKGVTVLKLRAARQRIRRREGRGEGRKPYGFRPNERAVLEHMKDLRRKPVKEDPLSFEGIAQQLNAEGQTTRYGKPWTRAGGARGVVASVIVVRDLARM